MGTKREPQGCQSLYIIDRRGENALYSKPFVKSRGRNREADEKKLWRAIKRDLKVEPTHGESCRNRKKGTGNVEVGTLRIASTISAGAGRR